MARKHAVNPMFLKNGSVALGSSPPTDVVKATDKLEAWKGGLGVSGRMHMQHLMQGFIGGEAGWQFADREDCDGLG